MLSAFLFHRIVFNYNNQVFYLSAFFYFMAHYLIQYFKFTLVKLVFLPKDKYKNLCVNKIFYKLKIVFLLKRLLNNLILIMSY